MTVIGKIVRCFMVIPLWDDCLVTAVYCAISSFSTVWVWDVKRVNNDKWVLRSSVDLSLGVQPPQFFTTTIHSTVSMESILTSYRTDDIKISNRKVLRGHALFGRQLKKGRG